MADALGTDTAFVWDGETDSDGAPCNFENVYECDACDVSWEDRWSCACDDDCPTCGCAISPTRSTVTNIDSGATEIIDWQRPLP